MFPVASKVMHVVQKKGREEDGGILTLIVIFTQTIPSFSHRICSLYKGANSKAAYSLTYEIKKKKMKFFPETQKVYRRTHLVLIRYQNKQRNS